jgi:hypothetical protein
LRTGWRLEKSGACNRPNSRAVLEAAMFPTNDTNLSVAEVFKWLAIIFAMILILASLQDFHSNVIKGWSDIEFAAGLILSAWALWYFWQRNED